MKKGRFLIPIFIFIISAYFYILTTSFRQLKAVEQVGPDFWPKIILLGVMILSILIFLNERKIKPRLSPDQVEDRSVDRRRVIWGLVLIFGYIILLDHGGFTLLTPIFMGCFMYLLGVRKKGFIMVSSLFLTAIIIILFAKFLLVALPRGVGVFREFSLFFY